MEKKTVHLLGVLHRPEFVEEVLTVILSRARPRQTIALEVSADHLKLFQAIRRQQLKEGLSFEKAFVSRFREIFQRDLKKAGWPQKAVEKAFWELPAEALGRTVLGLKFYYQLYSKLKEKGLKVIPLEEASILRKLASLRIKARREKNAVLKDRLELLTSLLELPAREKKMIERIINLKVKPDFLVVGKSHVKEIANHLKKRKIKTKKIYYYKSALFEVIEAKPAREDIMLRQAYWQKKRLAPKIRELYLKGRISREEMRKALSSPIKARETLKKTRTRKPFKKTKRK